jgi:peptidoglycan/xylan/chitin deacetylase (PgdA/CDA1 family)
LHIAAGVYFDGYPLWIVWLTLAAFLLVLVAGSIFIRWNFYMPSTHRLPLFHLSLDGKRLSLQNKSKQVALTFDDGPAACTEAILDILRKEQVPAAFFVIGKNIAGREHLLQRMVAEGHKIGNHSYEHGFNFDWKSSNAMQLELEQCNDAIRKVTGQQPKLFRPPYGVTNPNLARAVQATGMRSIGWRLRSMDTVARDPEALLKKILLQVRHRDIILLHDSCAITAQILPRLIATLKERGYSFASPI